MNEKARQKLILALDYPSLDAALEIAQTLSSLVGMFKINIQLFTAAGPASVAKLSALGAGIFLDLKFHDIPNTVQGAVRSAVALPGVRLLDVHALGGLEMMRAAAEARNGGGSPAGSAKSFPKLLAITVLTSMDNGALRTVGVAGPASRRVVQLARLSKKAGMDGVVASPQEVRAIQAGLRQGCLDCRSRDSSGGRSCDGRGAQGEGRRSSPHRHARRGDSGRGRLPRRGPTDNQRSRPRGGSPRHRRRDRFSN